MAFDGKNLEIPENLPLLPIRDIVAFPYMILPLFVGRESSIRAVEEALTKNRLIFLSSQKDINDECPNEEGIYQTGTIAIIMRMRKLSDGRVKILIQGVGKGVVKKYEKSEPFFQVSIDKIEETHQQDTCEQIKSEIYHTRKQVEAIITLGKQLSPDILLVLDDVDDPGRLADLVASNLGLTVDVAQKVLETHDHKERLKLVNQILDKEVETLKKQQGDRLSSADQIGANQREHFLREQMKAIRNELGDGDSRSEEMEEIHKQIKAAQMPEKTEVEALKQLARLEKMHPDASEASMVRTYLEWLCDLPWNSLSKDNLDLDHVKKILNEDHYDLHKIKDRILEFLAVRSLKSDVKSPILCFAGPPGVGKTSLGKSVARAMGREYFRVALGGLKDEAEIRGHRRTYVGAMPGKIVQALRQLKTRNPVIVLDEIDKLGSDFRGDPSAAMLEVLDPEQNVNFRDNYLNVDFDLSQCLFMATANVLENIPPALKDRMEVIQLSGYTENDKLLIAKKHLIDRQIENNGINKDQIEFKDDGIKTIISGYTREAGLRNLEREIGSVCRKVAKAVVLGEKEKTFVNKQKVGELLGAAKFVREDCLDEPCVGVATGLAWTQAGGETLLVEALKMKGKGGLKLTGQLGEVMKESAQAAMSYARAHYEKLGVSADFFDEYEIHLHLPAGAIPKDGPSAGITLATALISLMTEVPVRHDLAMTGELTLSGRVLPVGGIREKALAALNQGIKNVVVPLTCEKDLAEIPKELKRKINFILVENLDEVLSVAFAKTKDDCRERKTKKKNSDTTQVAA